MPNFITSLGRATRRAAEAVHAGAGRPARPHRSLLRPLGVVGYDAVEPALLAALATGEPVLLVSDHGAAKTFLAVRLAEALGLELRHYNASLLQFDDLAGFPIPTDDGGIRYAAPPGAVWGAEAVFLDEIGRCRPEVANKLFPIVHERRIQGIALEKLVHRWAATNPPREAQEGGDEDDVLSAYEGVERLDPALADRFTYVVRLPAWHELGDEDRTAVVRGIPASLDPDAAAGVRALVQATRDLVPAFERDLDAAATEYVLALAPRLASAEVTIGGRRAAMLRRAVIAVSAACAALGRPLGADAFATALLCAIPDVARRVIRRPTLLAAHTAAWKIVSVPDTDPERMLLATADPLRRVALALTLPDAGASLRGRVLADALAGERSVRGQLLAWHLFSRIAQREDVPAPAIEAAADLVRGVAEGGAKVQYVGAASSWVTVIRERVAASELRDEDAEFAFGALVAAWPDEQVRYAAAFAAQQKAGTKRSPIETYADEHLDWWRQCARALEGIGAGSEG